MLPEDESVLRSGTALLLVMALGACSPSVVDARGRGGAVSGSGAGGAPASSSSGDGAGTTTGSADMPRGEVQISEPGEDAFFLDAEVDGDHVLVAYLTGQSTIHMIELDFEGHPLGPAVVAADAEGASILVVGNDRSLLTHDDGDGCFFARIDGSGVPIGKPVYDGDVHCTRLSPAPSGYRFLGFTSDLVTVTTLDSKGNPGVTNTIIDPFPDTEFFAMTPPFADDSFLVAWSTEDGASTHARRFDPTGEPLNGETNAIPPSPSAKLVADGDAVLAISASASATGFDATPLDPTGAQTGTTSHVDVGDELTWVSVAGIDGGRTMIAWLGLGLDGAEPMGVVTISPDLAPTGPALTFTGPHFPNSFFVPHLLGTPKGGLLFYSGAYGSSPDGVFALPVTP